MKTRNAPAIAKPPPQRPRGRTAVYCAPAILWEQPFVALAQASCIPAQDPRCNGGSFGPPEPSE